MARPTPQDVAPVARTALADPSTRLSDPERHADEASLETTLRPLTLDDFVGQANVRESLNVFLSAGESAQRGGRPRAPRRPGRASARREWPASWPTSSGSRSRTRRARS